MIMLLASKWVSETIAESATPLILFMAKNACVRSRSLRVTPVRGKGCASRSVDFAHEREHLSTIYSLPDRNVVADGGNFIRRPGFLSVVACSSVAPGRFSDDPGRSITAGRQPRNH